MKRAVDRITRAAAVGVCLLCLSIGARADTLADALIDAYKNSGLIEQNRALLRAADEDVAFAAAALLPIINWSSEVTREFGDIRSASTAFSSRDIGNTTAAINLTTQLQLYDFGADSARIAAQKETVLATRWRLTSVEQAILLRAVEAHMRMREALENVTLRQNNLRVLGQELQAAQDRFDVGEVTRTDVALAEARLASARAGLAQAEGILLQAREFFRNAVGRNPGTIGPPPNLPAVQTNVAQAKAVAVRTHPDIAEAQKQVAAAELLIAAAEADMKPTLSAVGRLRLEETFDSDANLRSGQVGLEVTGPIYQGGRLSSAARRSMAIRDAQRANLHVVRLNIEESVGSAIASFVTATASIQANQEQVRAARVAFQGIREEATLGARTTLDVLTAEQDLLDASAALIAAQVNQQIAAYTVLASMGLLTAERLNLPVQIYDPEAYYNLVKDGATKNSPQGRKLDQVLRALQKD